MKKVICIRLGILVIFIAKISVAGEELLYHDKDGWQEWWVE